mgnify:FL=1
MIDRSEELRKQGYEIGGQESEGGGSDNSGFVKWGENENAIEGVIETFFDVDGRQNCVMKVEKVFGDDPLMAKNGTELTEITSGMSVALGLSSATLKDKIPGTDVGETYHILFQKWAISKKTGNRFRLFNTFKIPKDKAEPVKDTPAVNDDLPF